MRTNSMVMRKQTTASPARMPMKMASRRKKRSPRAALSGDASEATGEAGIDMTVGLSLKAVILPRSDKRAGPPDR